MSSIGLTEHIGVKNYPSYFEFLKSKLRTDGLLLNHCITRNNNKSNFRASSFTDRYVFPDGELTGSGRILSANPGRRIRGAARGELPPPLRDDVA